jgi:hypothetical protein
MQSLPSQEVIASLSLSLSPSLSLSLSVSLPLSVSSLSRSPFSYPGLMMIPLLRLSQLQDKEAWIDGHDEVDKPLTINVRLKPLVQSLMAFHSLQPDNRPLLPDGKDLKKVKVQLHI